MPEQRKFLDLRDADLAAYATAPDAPIAIPAEYLETVLANLHGLYGHAKILKAALAATPDAPAPDGPFEP
jgi:hypothetical protein